MIDVLTENMGDVEASRKYVEACRKYVYRHVVHVEASRRYVYHKHPSIKNIISYCRMCSLTNSLPVSLPLPPPSTRCVQIREMEVAAGR